MKIVIWGVFTLIFMAASACEPTDEMQLAAEAKAPRTVSRIGGDLASGSVDLTFGLVAPADAADVAVRVLDASRVEWPGVERLDATTLRVPIGKPGVHEILIEATATLDGRAVRTETVVRVPFGVPEPIVDDGEIAVFAMEPRR